MENDILDVKQAAELLECAENTIYTKVHRKEIPYRKKNGRLIFSRQELERMKAIENGEMTTELIKSFVAKNPALMAFMHADGAVQMLRDIMVNFNDPRVAFLKVPEKYEAFAKALQTAVAIFVSDDYKKSNLNEN